MNLYFHLEEVHLKSGTYLTELTWSYLLRGESHDSHYAIRHPGAEDVTLQLQQLDPAYQAPQRYSDEVIATAFLTDYASLPPGSSIFGTSEEQCHALETYLLSCCWMPRTHAGNFHVLRDHFTPDAARSLEESLQAVRGNALGLAA